MICVSLPNNWCVESPNEFVVIAVLAEELGFDSIWTAGHLLNGGYVSERIGDRPYYHGLCTLAYVAAKTTKIALMTSVVVLPFRHPMELAKYAATLDQFSGGRGILGVCVSGLHEEFQDMGIHGEQRGAISSQTSRIGRNLWTV